MERNVLMNAISNAICVSYLCLGLSLSFPFHSCTHAHVQTLHISPFFQGRSAPRVQRRKGACPHPTLPIVLDRRSITSLTSGVPPQAGHSHQPPPLQGPTQSGQPGASVTNGGAPITWRMAPPLSDPGRRGKGREGKGRDANGVSHTPASRPGHRTLTLWVPAVHS